MMDDFFKFMDEYWPVAMAVAFAYILIRGC